MSATTYLWRRNYAGDTCKNEEFPAATFGKAFCIFWYLGVAKNRQTTTLTVFCVDGWHRWTVEMAPTEGSQITIIFFSGVDIIHATDIIGTVAITSTAITSTMTIRLPTVDKHNIAAFQIILLSFIDQLSFPILDHKAKVRLKFLTLAGVRSDRC